MGPFTRVPFSVRICDPQPPGAPMKQRKLCTTLGFALCLGQGRLSGNEGRSRYSRTESHSEKPNLRGLYLPHESRATAPWFGRWPFHSLPLHPLFSGSTLSHQDLDRRFLPTHGTLVFTTTAASNVGTRVGVKGDKSLRRSLGA